MARDADGVFRVIGSRVTLDSIVHLFKSGATAEQIQEDFPSVTLSDVYSVLAYYLQHSREVERYLEQQDQASRKLREHISPHRETKELRDRIRLRRARSAV